MNTPRFTLIELMVVIVIIAFLSTILLSALAHSREKAKITLCQAYLQQLRYYVDLYSSENREYILPVADFRMASWYNHMSCTYWQGTLAKLGYWTAKQADALECPLLPAGSTSPRDGVSFFWRPFSQVTYKTWDGNLNLLNWPRIGRSFYMNRSPSDGGRVRYIKIREIQSPSTVIEFADMEPIWAWGDHSIRFNYTFTANGTELAETTHRAQPNFGFIDGHVERMAKADADPHKYMFWWFIPPSTPSH